MTASPASLPSPASDPRVRIAGLAFLVLVAATCGSIAPMGIAAALCVLTTLVLFLRTPWPAWPRTPVDAAGFGWLVALAVAAAFAVERHHGGFPRLGKGLMPLLVGLAAFHTADRARGRRALAVFLAVAGAVALIGFGIWFAQGHTYAARARGLAGHYMTFGGQLLLQLPVALAVACTARERRWRWGAAAVAALVAVALAVTFTRSSWLGAFVSCAIVLAAVVPWGVVALAALGLGAWFFAPGEWHTRLHSMFDAGNGWNVERVLMWKAGLQMFRGHPWTGVGIQEFGRVYQTYRSPLAQEAAGHLHNAYIHIAATMGVIGLAAFVWLYGSLLRTSAAGLRVGPGFAARLRDEGVAAGVRLGVTAALVGFLVAGLFEWNFGDEELLYPLYLLVGIAWASRGWGGAKTS